MEINLATKLEELDVAVNEITDEITKNMAEAVAQTAKMTFQKANELAALRLHSTRQQYIDALKFEEEGDGIYVVYLMEDAHHLEDGYPAFPMLPKLAQGPKSKISKEGHSYTIIPLRQGTTYNINRPVVNLVKHDLAAKLQALSQDRNAFKTVRTETDKKTGRRRTVERLKVAAPHRHLQGLTRVREFEPGAKSPAQSAYFTFRVASTKQDAGKQWKHPGFKGANIFPDLERWADLEIDRIIAQVFDR